MTVDDPSTSDDVLTTGEYEKKLNVISEKLIMIKADIAGLAEVENTVVLKDIAKKAGYEYFYIEKGNDPRGINLALLSKYKVKYVSHKSQKTPYKGNINYKFSRDCPEAVLEINGKTIYILLNHLKSRVSTKSENTEIKRIAQANGILDIISGIYKNKRTEPYILVMGDLNDTRHSSLMNNLEKSGLVIINYFYNEEKYFTYLYKNKKEDCDYILMNRNMYQNIKIKKYMAYNAPDFLNASDHFPLYLEIEY